MADKTVSDGFVPSKPTHILKVKRGDEFVELSGLWTNTDKNGNEYLRSAALETGEVFFIMTNNFKDA